MELYIEKLKTIRKRKKITGEELAKKMGISRITLGAWENAKRIPSEAKIRMLARVLDISVSEISDLVPDKKISEINLSPLGTSINFILGGDKDKNINRQATIVSGIMSMIKELSDAKLIIGAMLSSLPSIFYIKGTDFRYITANEAFLKNLSLDINYSVMGKRDSDLLPQNEAIINAEMDKQVIADGKSILNRECYIPGSRKTKWGIMSKIPIFDQEGKIEGLVGFFIDITVRKKLEEKYDRIVNMSPQLICVAGMDGYFKFVNPTWEKVLGYNSEELLAKPFLNFVHPDDHISNNTEMASLANGNLCIDFENRYIHKNGEIRYLQWTAAPVPDEKLIYCIAKDVTEHKQTEEALRVHQIELEMQNVEQRRTHEELDLLRQRYFDLYDLAPVGFCTIGKTGLIIEANLTASNLFGVNRRNLVDKPISRFILPEDQNIYYLKHKKLSVTGKRQAWNMQMLNAKGISFWAYLQASSGKNDEYMIAINDITESKKVEEELRVHQIELETQNEELRRTHVELEAVRQRYFDLYDLAAVGFCTINEKGLIIEANLTTATLFGMERNKLLKQPISRFILPEDQDIYYLKRKTLLNTGKQQAWDMRLVDATGSPFLSYIHGMPGQNENIMLTINKTLCRKSNE